VFKISYHGEGEGQKLKRLAQTFDTSDTIAQAIANVAKVLTASPKTHKLTRRVTIEAVESDASLDAPAKK